MSSSAKCGAQSVSAAASPLLEALATLARAGVEFIVVGVSGINFYARDASDAVVTADVDVFLSPRVEVLRSALGALRSSGLEFWAGDEPFLDFDDSEILANLISSGANVTAENEAGARVDLMLSGGGFRYDDLAAAHQPSRSATRSISSGSSVIGTRITSSVPRSRSPASASRRACAEVVVTVGSSFSATSAPRKFR